MTTHFSTQIEANRLTLPEVRAAIEGGGTISFFRRTRAAVTRQRMGHRSSGYVGLIDIVVSDFAIALLTLSPFFGTSALAASGGGVKSVSLEERLIPTNTENVCTPPRQGQSKPASAQRWALLSGASDGRIDDARAVNRSRGPARIEMREQFPLQPEQTERLIGSMSALQNSPRNRLLVALPPSNLKHLMPELEFIRCHRDQVLMDADSSLDYVFFPETGVVSVVAVYADGSIIEMATIGREGCTAVQAVFGAKRSSVRLLVQIPGTAAKMSRAAFTRAMGSMPSFQSLMYAYVQAFLEQVLVSVACNGAHNLKQRLARWLLMMRDRGDDDVLQITQNLLSEMLGVQRPTITKAAHELERAGLIARGRRQVTIIDRQGLMAASCECYQLVRMRVAVHLPKTYT